MKVYVFIPGTLILSALLVVLFKVRQEEREKVEKQAKFVDVKLRVSEDVLREYANEKVQINQDIDVAKDEYKKTDENMKASQGAADSARAEELKCAEEQKPAKDELDKLEAEFTNLKAESDKELESLKAEVEALKKQMEGQSPVCAFVKNKSEASKLCDKQVKTEEKAPDKAAEAPKEPEKAEESKPEEKAAEAPKEPEKAEEPKPEEKAAEAPKEPEKAQ